jgi:hypothetical protein
MPIHSSIVTYNTFPDPKNFQPLGVCLGYWEIGWLLDPERGDRVDARCAGVSVRTRDTSSHERTRL